MRYYEIHEARRNPEQNRKISAYEAISKYKDDDDVYISFVADVGTMSKSAEGFKIGINPKSNFNTPNGIYSYPVRAAWRSYADHRERTLDVPFAGEQPFIQIFRPKNPSRVMELKQYSSLHYDKDYDILADMIIEFFMTKNRMSEAVGWEAAKAILAMATDKSRNNTPGGKFWNMARFTFFALTGQLATSFIDEYEEDLIKLMQDKTAKANKGDEKIRLNIAVHQKNDTPTALWNKIFRKCGYDGISDKYGQSIIHPAEPTQAVFFNGAFIKVLEGVYNKAYKTPGQTTAESTDPKSAIMIREWLKETHMIGDNKRAFKAAVGIRKMFMAYAKIWDINLEYTIEDSAMIQLFKQETVGGKDSFPDYLDFVGVGSGGQVMIDHKGIKVYPPDQSQENWDHIFDSKDAVAEFPYDQLIDDANAAVSYYEMFAEHVKKLKDTKKMSIKMPNMDFDDE
jgi:hypothetical protein